MHLLGCDSEDGVRTTSCEEAADNVSTTVWVNSNIRFVHSFHPSHAVHSRQTSADFEMPMYHPHAYSRRPGRPLCITLLSSPFQQPFDFQPFFHIRSLHKPGRFIRPHHQYLG